MDRAAEVLALGAGRVDLSEVVLWNICYLDAAVHQLRTQGYPVPDELAA